MTPEEMKILVNEADAIDAGQAARDDAAANGNLDPSGNIVPVDPNAQAMEWMFVGEILGFMAKAILPETAPHYTEQQSLMLAHAFVPVAEKYGWSGNKLAPELALAMAGFGFAMPAIMAYRQRKAAPRDPETEPEQDGDGSRK